MVAVVATSICAWILAVGFLLDVEALSLGSGLGRVLQVATLAVGTPHALMSRHPVPRLAAIAVVLGALSGAGSEWVSLVCTVGVPEVAWRSVCAERHRSARKPALTRSAPRPSGSK